MRPPRLARRLLGWSARSTDRDSLLFELETEFTRLADAEGSAAARRWYRQQARRSILPLLAERLRVRRGAQTRLEQILIEFRHAARTLVRHGSTSALVVVTLGLASAAALASIAVLDAVLLSPLPYAAPDRLVRLWNTGPGVPPGVKPVSFQDLEDWRRSSTTLAALSASSPVSATLTERGDPRRLEGVRVGVDFDRVFGLHAVAGRLFTRDDYAAGAEPVVVVTHTFWSREFPEGRVADGHRLMLDGRPRRIVGVLPLTATTYPAAPFDFWIPLVPREGARWEFSRATGWIDAIGRLHEGVSIQDATRELSAIAATLASDFPASNGSRPAMALHPLHEDLVGAARPALILVGLSTTALLVVAFGNVLHLLVAHGVSRRREFCVRHALGAGRDRLGRQAALEAAILSALAITAGLALSPLMLRALEWLPTTALPRRNEIHILPDMLGWATALLCVTMAAIGWPMVRSATRPAISLAGASSRVTESRADRRTRYALVAAQVGLSVLLILGGVLFVQTLHRLQSIPLGFSPEQVLTLQVTPLRTTAATGAATLAFYRDAMDHIRALPGITHVAASTHVPFVAFGWSFSVAAHDGPPEVKHIVRVAVASEDYFDAIGGQIIDGRALTAEEHRQGADVTVISERLARLLFGDHRAAGRLVDYSNRQWRVTGVVADMRGRVDASADATMYLPWHNAGPRTQVLLVRTADPSGQLDAVRRRIREIDAHATIAGAGPLEERVMRTLAPQRFRAGLLAGLAVLAAILAIVGAYSVTTFVVASQRREQAIRLALGERVSEARRRIVLASVRPATIGAAGGLAAAWYSRQFISAFLFETSTADARLLAVPVVVLLLVAIAAVVPSARLSRADPASVFRDEQ